MREYAAKPEPSSIDFREQSAPVVLRGEWRGLFLVDLLSPPDDGVGVICPSIHCGALEKPLNELFRLDGEDEDPVELYYEVSQQGVEFLDLLKRARVPVEDEAPDAAVSR